MSDDTDDIEIDDLPDGPEFYCQHCGNDLYRDEATWHDGDPWCAGCDRAFSEPACFDV